MGKTLIPLLAKGATPSLLPGPLNERNALNIAGLSQLHQFLDDASVALDVHIVSPAAFQPALKAVLTEAAQPDITPVTTASEAPVTSRPKRLRASFLAGSGLGQRIILLPLGDGDLEPLREFVSACHMLGASGQSLTHIERYLHEPSSFKGSDNAEETRRRIEEFLKQLSNVEEDLPLAMNGIELGWYKLGFLLNQVQALALIRATDVNPEADGEKSTDGPLLALRATFEMLDIPQPIVEALNNVVKQAQSGEDASDFYRRCQSIAQAIHSLLDMMVKQPTPSPS